MSYNNDSMLVLANKYGKMSSDAKAEMFETYDRIRDLTVSGSNMAGGTGGYGTVSSFLLNLSRLIAPSSFMPMLGSSAMNIPGTSYASSVSGGNTGTGAQAAFGVGSMGNYPGFSGGAAGIGALGSDILGVGSISDSLATSFSIGGLPTGGAASTVGGDSYVPSADLMNGVSMASGGFSDIVMPTAGVVAGVGSLVSSMAPYFGPFGMLAGMSANLATGMSGALISTYQRTTGQIVNNADTIMSMKVKNIETIVKQLDTEGDAVRKLLKSGLDADNKAIQDMS